MLSWITLTKNVLKEMKFTYITLGKQNGMSSKSGIQENRSSEVTTNFPRVFSKELEITNDEGEFLKYTDI